MLGLVTLKNYSEEDKFLREGYSFKQDRSWLLKRELLREELKKEFEEIFNNEP